MSLHILITAVCTKLFSKAKREIYSFSNFPDNSEAWPSLGRETFHMRTVLKELVVFRACDRTAVIEGRS